MKIQHYRWPAALYVASGLVLTSLVWAADNANNNDNATLEEVVVTATRVQTDLQKTPIAVTALSATTLEQHQVTNLADLNSLAPNLTVGTRSGTGAASGVIAIRGIGLDANQPASPAVGVYVDDVYMPNAYGNLIDLFDVERIEVLRGPQGTLFGRNTIGGAIQYVTMKPLLNQFGGFVEGTAGNLNRGDLSGALNVPLGDRAALRVSLASFYRDGYVHDDLNNINRGQQHSKEARVQFRMNVTDKLTVDAKFDLQSQTSNGRTSIPVSFYYTPPSFAAPFAPNGLNKFISTDLYNIAGFNNPDNFYSDQRVGQIIVGYALTDKIQFKSISAFQYDVGRLNIDQDSTPLSIFAISRGTETDDLFTQEFQLVGTSFDDHLHWTTGLYYYDGLASLDGVTASVFGSPPISQFGDYSLSTKSGALYGQATYDLTSKLAVVVGLRYTKEDQSLNGGRTPVGAPCFTCVPYTQDLTYNDTAPLLGLNYQATTDVMLYLKASKGFRAGGFTPLAFFGQVFKPETAWTYEAGARMQFLDGQLRVNPTYFHTDWTQVQYNSQIFLPPPVNVLPDIANGPDVRADGLELESQWAITKQLSLNLSGSYLDARYSGNLPPALPGQAPHFTLQSDLGRAPAEQFLIGGVYNLPLGNAGDLTSSVSYAWTAKERSASSDQEYIELPSVGLLTARIEYALPRGHYGQYRIAVFGTNLTNRAYINGGTDFPADHGPIPAELEDVAPPREYGVTLHASF